MTDLEFVICGLMVEAALASKAARVAGGRENRNLWAAINAIEAAIASGPWQDRKRRGWGLRP